MPEPSPKKPAPERIIERWLFRSRWLLAPIYLGLVFGLGGMIVVFVREEIRAIPTLTSAHPQYAIVSVLSMVDVALAASLVLIVIFAGYEQFVSRIDVDDRARGPAWMGEIDFGGMKLKLLASLVAISAVALLRAFIEIADGEAAPSDHELAWLIGLHLTFVVSAVCMALMEWVISKLRRPGS